MNELWQPVVGYEDLYEVSNLGRVRSVDRYIERMNRWGTMNRALLKGRILRPGRSVCKRLQVNLSKNNVPWMVAVHRLVSRAFLGPCPVGLEVDHVDGNYENNCADNLEYVTHQQNQKRAYDMGKINPPLNARCSTTGRFTSA